MEAPITLQPVTSAREVCDRHGRLIFFRGELAALVVRLDDEVHEEDIGRWFLEAAFGDLDGARRRVFASLEEAQAWVAARVGKHDRL